MNDAEQKAFGDFLVKEKKVLSQENLENCLEVQKALIKLGIEKSIDKVIVEKSLVENEPMAALVREFIGGDEELLPGYRIVRKLGEGAMGEVYEGIDLINGERSVAIKMLYSHLAKRKATAQRFIQEAQLCISKLNHPNIVKGYEVGYEGTHDCFFYVMELVEGSNLTKVFKQHGPFSEELAIIIMLQIASALDHAFQFHLVHRDVKPDNIMLTPQGDAKLCDLGLARDWGKDLSLTRTGAVMGTPYYISPEAAAGSEQLDCRSDIYSLGATIYHMTAGRVPFSGPNSQVVLSRHISAPLIPLLEIRDDISTGFSAVIQMMMEKKPEDRYQTPGSLMEDIQKLQSGLLTRALEKYQEAIPIYQPKPKHVVGDVSSGEVEIEEMEIPSGEIEVINEDTVNLDDTKSFTKRQDSVEEYLVSNIDSPKQAKIWRNFFTSSERRVLSKSETVQSKLLIMGAVIGGVVLIGTILLCYLLIKLLSRLLP